jgi:hypothetical protein
MLGFALSIQHVHGDCLVFVIVFALCCMCARVPMGSEALRRGINTSKDAGALCKAGVHSDMLCALQCKE